MIEFPDTTPALLQHVNPRSERHGDAELVPAMDLRLQIECGRALLEQFAKGLGILYVEKRQKSLVDGDDVERRFPNMAMPLKFDDEQTGCTLVLDMGLGDEVSSITLRDVLVHKHSLELLDGGTVRATFTATVVDPDVAILGKLGTLVQHQVYLQLRGPTA